MCAAVAAASAHQVPVLNSLPADSTSWLAALPRDILVAIVPFLTSCCGPDLF